MVLGVHNRDRFIFLAIMDPAVIKRGRSRWILESTSHKFYIRENVSIVDKKYVKVINYEQV